MTPSEIANNALQATLETVQSLMKRCMKLKESDPGTLTLSDEITRHLAKDLKLYGGSATSFSPQLLSCAAVVREHSKAGIFVSLPDWRTVIDDDPRIRSHPRFHKTVDYRPSTLPEHKPPASASAVPEEAAKPLAESIPVMMPATPSVSNTFVPSTPVLQTSEVPVMEPMVSDIRSSAADTTAWEALTPLPYSIAPVMVRHNIPMVGGMKTQPETTLRPRKTKRKVEESDNDSKEAEALSGLTQTPISQKPIRKQKKKFMSDEEDHRAAGTIIVKHKALSVKTFNVVAPDATSAGTSAPEWLDDRGFWDEETRPARWGLDSNIAITVEQSVRYHSWKCDKCVKLKVPCVVLPDKKFGFTRLACANCDEMKIACTIDSAGVRQRLQVKAKEAVGEANINPLPKRPSTRANKSHPAAKSLEKSALAKTTKPATCSNSHAAQTVAVDDTLNEKPTRPKYEAPLAPHNMGSSDLSTPSEAALPAIASIPAPFQPSLPTNLSEPEPSGRDILRSIQDLGRRFDLLATNERVDTLDVRVDSVEDRFGWRLMELEKQITASDVRWQSVTSSMGNLSMSLRVHKNDPAVHRPGSSNDSTYKLQTAAADERLGISTVGRERTYACN
ncbi:uncharacterized protein F5891DRAFT_987253 [Suillus fuscotomentosus]|uniref:Uncharacterized protein n=1 Tax=Suillus fuscotomentosus TaxID=1912939 RepID=A0AAD4DQG8_9AGAM|nr:uncharacterized protein F5891DRAFT_987253 [Suillus fuscotomentosus]KAG1889760.1 hypothetical protein F5891DRAFT_987253 [Suillus fuscotomentosus]